MTPGSAVVFCPDDRYLMPMSNSLPWGAVGYMDNGCTATLIDSRHIVAAAHCFCYDDTGFWQDNLFFYPNFNPNRTNTQSFAIDRAVVGTRVETGGEFQASDWGIGHLAKDVTDFPALPIACILTVPANVNSSGYGRDLSFFGMGQAPPGGSSKMGCNVWWQPALVDPECKVYKIDQDQLFFDCATVGGNSGSPVLYKIGNNHFLAGVIHGPGNPVQWHGWWSIADLQVEPGSPVSVASRGANNLDVFVVGKDGGIYTAAWGPQTDSTWKGWWRISDLEAKPGSSVSVTSRGADWLDIFVVGNDGGIYTASWNPAFEDGWHGWWRIGDIAVDPGSPVSVVSRSANKLDVFVTGSDGGIYTAAWEPGFEDGWHGWWRIGNNAVDPGSPVSVVSRSADKLDVFVTGSDGGIYTAAWEPGFEDGWHGWWRIGNNAVDPGSPVSVVSRGADKLDVFVTGSDGGIYTAAWEPGFTDGWHGWSRIGDLAADPESYIAAVSRGTDKLDIFVVGPDGKVQANGWEPKFPCGWKGWQNVLDASFKPGSCLGAISRSSDWLDVFAASVDSNVYTAAWNPAFTCEACGDQGPALDHLNAGPSAKRFQYAPRFAKNVAIARHVDGSARTEVFVIDSDNDLVVTRSRNGNSVADGFSAFSSLGSITSPRQIAAFIQTNAKPQVVVTSEAGKLYTRAVSKSSDSWNGWTTIDLPAGVTEALDVDAAYDSEGNNQIFVVGDDGNLYTRGRINKEPDSAWKGWEKLTASGSIRKVTALRRADGTEQAFLIDSAGGLATLWQMEAKPSSSWTAPGNFENPSKSAIIDIDAAWTEDEQTWIFAVDEKGALWVRAMVSKDSSQGWGDWQPWATNLYAPSAKSLQPQPEGIVSLTASRWQEETGGDIVPVVFATDNKGNIYYTTHDRSGGWSAWRSFYH
ncbi:trypsin-like serine protease [Methanothrix sp.]|uniref:trypsin-like serine protease n=1 Tax=Methanothrix sp. TaxID=90426 RepID=UPI00345E768D